MLAIDATLWWVYTEGMILSVYTGGAHAEASN